MAQGDPRQHPRERDEHFQGLHCMIGTSDSRVIKCSLSLKGSQSIAVTSVNLC